MLLAFPVDVATSSCVKPNSLLSLSKPLASSTGLRSSLCRFSIKAETSASWSCFWSTRHGIEVNPAFLDALNLLSPAITSNSFNPSSLTRIGERTPWFFMEFVSSSSFPSSKFDLGWNLPGLIFSNSISFTVLWLGVVWPRSASRPLFSIFFSSDIFDPSNKLSSQS